MNYRLATIHARKAYTSDTTEVIDIDVQDPISQLIIELSANISNDTAITAHAIACLTKIELVDGSDVLYSLSGYQAEAADWYTNHVFRSPWNIYMGWGETQRFVGINFGRKLWDPMLAFDPKKFRNPQLKLTLDINAGGAVPTQDRLGVWAAMFDEKTISPVGFLMQKEIKSYTMGSASHEYTDMPTDHPYRKLFIRAQSVGTEPGALIDKIKLYEDEGKRVIFEHIPEEVLRSIAFLSPQIEEYIHARVATSATQIYCTPTTRVYPVATELETTSASGGVAIQMGDGGRFAAITATLQKYFAFHVKGYLPHAVYEIPFGDQEDMNDWYDVTKVGSLKLDVLSLAAGSGVANSIFLQQLRKY